MARRNASALLRLAILASGLLIAGSARSKPGYGSNVDAYCTANARTPATPYAGDCAICHNENSDALDRTPGFNEYRIHKGDGDFSFFCPLAAPNQPPILNPIGNLSADVGGLISLRITASDPDGGVLLLEAADLPLGATFQANTDGTGDFVWMPSAAQTGNHSVLFMVTDAGQPPASASERIVITVGNVNRPPTLDPIGNQLLKAGERLAVPLRATDSDGGVLLFSATGLPAAASLLDLGGGNAELSWQTEVADFGSYPLSITVTDDGVPPESDSEDVVITVGSSNNPPELAPIGNRRQNPGELFTLTFTSTDLDGDALSYVLLGTPAGATFTDAGDGSATLTWLPEDGVLGRHQLTLTVLDDGIPVETDQEIFVLTVGSAGTGERAPDFRCGAGFDLVFLLLPILWLRGYRFSQR